VLAVPDETAHAGAGGPGGRLVVLAATEADVPRLADAAVRHYLSYAYSR
jgi:hypothetical protein